VKVPNDYHIKSLAKGLRVLRCFEASRGPLHLVTIATTTGLPLPTVFRIARTLEAEGFLEQTEDGAFRPGLGVLRLGFAALDGMDLVRLSTPHLQALAEATMETVNLGVLDDVDARYLVRIRNADLVTADIRVGSLLPASCTSMGKLLLAYLPETVLAERLPHVDFRSARGPHAIRDRDRLVDELRAIRIRGWSSQDEELEYGLRSIAVPVRDRAGAVVAAVNLAVPATRWTVAGLAERFLSELAAAAARVSRDLGFVERAATGEPDPHPEQQGRPGAHNAPTN
jgi:IclR family pca regulon transcriptional regulator